MNIYERAKQTYESITPIRGTNDVRPLRRREHTRQIVKNADDSYSYRLYATDLVTCYPDGRLEIFLNRWYTPTTLEFIDNFVPAIRVHKQDGIVWLRFTVDYILECNGHKAYGYIIPVPVDKVLYLKQTANVITVEGRLALRRKYIDKLKSKQTRANYKNFIDWVTPILTIKGDEPFEDSKYLPDSVIVDCIYSDDINDYYDALLGIAYRSTVYKWMSNIIDKHHTLSLKQCKDVVMRMCYAADYVWQIKLTEVSPECGQSGYCGVAYDRG